MTEPTTPTGKRLYGRLRAYPLIRDDIRAIEAEAKAQERERLRSLAHRAYEKDKPMWGQCMVCGEDGVDKEDVDAFFDGNPQP